MRFLSCVVTLLLLPIFPAKAYDFQVRASGQLHTISCYDETPCFLSLPATQKHKEIDVAARQDQPGQISVQFMENRQLLTINGMEDTVYSLNIGESAKLELYASPVPKSRQAGPGSSLLLYRPGTPHASVWLTAKDEDD